MILRLFEAELQVLLNLRNLLQVVTYLKSLHVYMHKTVVRSSHLSGYWHLPWAIRANLWYLLKFNSCLCGAVGDERYEGFPSRQKVRSVKYRPMKLLAHHSRRPDESPYQGKEQLGVAYSVSVICTRDSSAHDRQACAETRGELSAFEEQPKRK